MAERFIITGLPRTRGAWLSVVANLSPGVRCFHEPCAEMSGWRDIRHIFEDDAPRYVGISDSMLGFHLPEILAEYGPRVLIVERPIGDVQLSLANMGIVAPRFCELLRDALDRIDDPRVMRVPFAALSSLRHIVSALRHVIPDAQIDTAKVAEMMHLVVQEDLVRTMRLARARAATLDQFLPAEIIREMSA